MVAMSWKTLAKAAGSDMLRRREERVTGGMVTARRRGRWREGEAEDASKEEAGGAKGEGKARFTGRGGEGDLGGGG